MAEEDFQIELSRKEIIDGDLYVNVNDLVKELNIAVKRMDLMTLTVLKSGNILTAAEIYRNAEAFANTAAALARYADDGKFDEVTKEFDQPTEEN